MALRAALGPTTSAAMSTSLRAVPSVPRLSSWIAFHSQGQAESTSLAAEFSSTFSSFSGFPADFLRFSKVKECKIKGGHLCSGRNDVQAVAVAAPPTFKTLTPLGDRVLIKIQAMEEKTQGGILLPTTAQTKPQRGEVVTVGEGKKIGDKQLPSSVAVGDIVIYSKYAGTEVEFYGADHLLLKEDDIFGLLSTDDIKDLKPLNERVLIKVATAEGKTAGGVLLTETAKEKPVIGRVVSVGPGTYGGDGEKKPLSVEPGNTVLYSKFVGNDFKGADGSEYIVLRAVDILAVLS